MTNVNINIDVFNDGRYMNVTSLYQEIEDDVGVTGFILLGRLLKDKAFFDELKGDNKIYNGFTNKIEDKKETISLAKDNNVPHIVISIKDCFDMFRANEEKFYPIQHSYILVPRLFEYNKIAKAFIITKLQEKEKRSKV